MKISVITPTYNEGATVEATIASVAAQTYKDVEHIIVDGYSDDATSEILDFAVGIRAFKRERRGVYDALNFGLEQANGDVIGLLHGNDKFSSPHILEAVAKAFEDDPELDFIYGNVKFVNPSSGRVVRRYNCSDFRPSQVLYGFYPPHPSLYVRRRVYEKVGPYTTKYVTCGDFDMWVRLFLVERLRYRYLDLDMVTMSPGGLSWSLRARLWYNTYDRLRVLRDHGFAANPLRLLKKYWIMYKTSYR